MLKLPLPHWFNDGTLTMLLQAPNPLCHHHMIPHPHHRDPPAGPHPLCSHQHPTLLQWSVCCYRPPPPLPPPTHPHCYSGPYVATDPPPHQHPTLLQWSVCCYRPPPPLPPPTPHTVTVVRMLLQTPHPTNTPHCYSGPYVATDPPPHQHPTLLQWSVCCYRPPPPLPPPTPHTVTVVRMLLQTPHPTNTPHCYSGPYVATDPHPLCPHQHPTLLQWSVCCYRPPPPLPPPTPLPTL